MSPFKMSINKLKRVKSMVNDVFVDDKKIKDNIAKAKQTLQSREYQPFV